MSTFGCYYFCLFFSICQSDLLFAGVNQSNSLIEMNEQKMTSSKYGHLWSCSAFGKVRFLGQKSKLVNTNISTELLKTLLSWNHFEKSFNLCNSRKSKTIWMLKYWRHEFSSEKNGLAHRIRLPIHGIGYTRDELDHQKRDAMGGKDIV